MTESKPELSRPADGSTGLIRDVGLWLGAVIASGGLVFWLLDGLRVRDWLPFRHALAGSDMYDLTRSTVALTGLLGATVAVALAIRRQRSTEQTVLLTAQAQKTAADAQLITARAYELDLMRNDQEQVRDLRDRFTTAAGQLGNDAPAVRLAGVYAMAGLADDWLQREQSEEAQGCIDVLCSYIRTPRRTNSDEDTRADLEVRQTIIRTITNRLQAGERATRDWRGRDFDFTGATFDGTYTFVGAQFTGGIVTFDNAKLSGGKVAFDNGRFIGGRVSFRGVQFTGSSVTFDFATVSGSSVTFDKASFVSGEVDFFFAQFNGGAASFDRADFAGSSVTFLGSVFAGGAVTFDQANFTGGVVSFHSVQVTGGAVTFNRSQFLGGQVRFDGTSITGGNVTFANTRFAGGIATFGLPDITVPVPGPWGDRPPEVWPPEDR
jgi:hypothetical protein